MDYATVTAFRAFGIPEPQKAVPQEVRARTQALVGAVQVLNQAGAAGDGKEVTFSTDAATRTPVVRVVDARSREVIVQWPSEYALRLAEEYKKEHRNK